MFKKVFELIINLKLLSNSLNKILDFTKIL